MAEERLNRQLAMQAKKSKELNELNAKNQELNELSAGAAGLTNRWPGEAMVMNGKGYMARFSSLSHLILINCYRISPISRICIS